MKEIRFPLIPVFDPVTHTVIFPIDKQYIQVQECVKKFALQHGFNEKDEFHFTLIGYDTAKKIAKKISKLSQQEQDLVYQSIETEVKSHEWECMLKNEVFHIQKTYPPFNGVEEKRESIILLIEVPLVTHVYSKISQSIGIPFDIPPTHITLYAKSSNPEEGKSGIGVSSVHDLSNYFVAHITEAEVYQKPVTTILFPTRPQIDTLITVLILKEFGESMFPGISKANYKISAQLPDGENESSLIKKGILLIDIGGGTFDHHTKPFQTTATNLIALFLHQKTNKALTKFFQLAERDDFYGKGTVSEDPLDRAFGLPGLLSALNKEYPNNPEIVIETILPLLQSVYREEVRRAHELPKELEEKIAQGKTQVLTLKHRGRNVKCMCIETGNTSMAGFLRSHKGGNYDVVAIRLPTGHTNILTRNNPQMKIDLRALAVMIRIEEAAQKGIELSEDLAPLAVSGTLPNIPEWYYDTATNSLLNGGPNPQNVPATKIDFFVLSKLIEIGITEKLWSPKG